MGIFRSEHKLMILLAVFVVVVSCPIIVQATQQEINELEKNLISSGDIWLYRKGTNEPDSAWIQLEYEETDWLQGPSGFGFGDEDDRTVLTDILRTDDDPATAEDESQRGYLSVYLRHKFQLSAESIAGINYLILRVDYDDGFKAYLNGTEIACANLPEGFVPHDQRAAEAHEAGTPENFDITSYKSLLRIGENVLAIQVHNRGSTSSDLSMIPELISCRNFADLEPMQEMTSKNSNQKQEEFEVDFDVPPSTPTQIAPNIFVGGRLEFQFEDERDFDLDSSEADALSLIEPVAYLASTLKSDEKFEAYFNLRYSKELEFEEEGRNDLSRPERMRFSQANLYFRDIFEKTDLKIGRQRFDDDREWLYDESLDAVRIFYQLGDIELDGSISWEGSFDMDLLGNRNDRRIDNYFFRAEYETSKKIKVAPYIAYRNDRSNRWSRPLFVGIHSSGELSKQMEYWAEFACVKGKEKKDDASGETFNFEGIGFDIGTIYEFDSPLNLSLVTGFAFGSGDNNPDDDLNKGFRQTGLQDNSDKLTGIASVDYYGELFDPELSNMMILTIGAGIEPKKDLTLETIYHYYLQDQKDDEIRDAEVDADPTGLSRDLGSEIDLVLGWRHSKKLDLKAGFGMFFPGDAFPDETNETAYLATLRLRYKF